MTVVLSDGIPVFLDDRVHSWANGLTETYGAVTSFGSWLSDTGAGSVNLDPDAIWSTQPAVRTVVSFLAKNIAQVAVHSFRRDAGGDRDRITDSPLAVLLGRPSPTATGHEWRHAMAVDIAMWDRYAAAILRVGDGWQLRRIPPRQWRFLRDGQDAPYGIVLASGDIWDLDRLLWVDGYPSAAESPMQTLRDTLTEEHESSAARRDMWANRARVERVIERPADAPMWSPAAREGFRSSWAAYARGGEKSGATPILEDGMRVAELGRLSPVDAQQLESRKLSRREVAAFFHVPPVMVGDAEASNYSNVVAYREQLYADTLGHWFSSLSDAMNARLVPVVAGDSGEFVEFNVGEKLRMSFDQQADIFSRAIGGAGFMTRNEVRRRMNLPAIPGADDLLTPLNMAESDVTSRDEMLR